MATTSRNCTEQTAACGCDQRDWSHMCTVHPSRSDTLKSLSASTSCRGTSIFRPLIPRSPGPSASAACSHPASRAAVEPHGQHHAACGMRRLGAVSCIIKGGPRELKGGPLSPPCPPRPSTSLGLHGTTTLLASRLPPARGCECGTMALLASFLTLPSLEAAHVPRLLVRIRFRRDKPCRQGVCGVMELHYRSISSPSKVLSTLRHGATCGVAR